MKAGNDKQVRTLKPKTKQMLKQKKKKKGHYVKLLVTLA